MELIFVFAGILFEIFRRNLFECMKIIRTFFVDTFMYTEKFTVFLWRKCVPAVRAAKAKRSGNDFTGSEGLSTNFALILTIAAVVIVDVMMRSPTKRTYDVFRNGSSITTLNRFDRFSVFPKIVFEKELPVLLDKSFNDRKLINLKFLICRGIGIVKGPLFERYISANKV